jgi:hypothetical protein
LIQWRPQRDSNPCYRRERAQFVSTRENCHPAEAL